MRDLAMGAGRRAGAKAIKKKVAVVGAGGPSGLAVLDVLSTLRDAGVDMDVVGFEAKSGCGGVWNREESEAFPSRVYDVSVCAAPRGVRRLVLVRSTTLRGQHPPHASP